ncbi:hypothetical protein VHEMI01546 [[Torrubiella] hemipterigena]|uniref:Uncharacterized protein n=1 Tax=[Torrubiella] hemipterigena TaxID=1531966 RepID=A0A0A1T528_9HYPO|nr:hypothetical protein VHEMI01546 [[Torrubiella] hemipterigena]
MADVDIEINTDLHKAGKEEINDEDLIQYDSDGGEAQEDGGTFDLEEPVMADDQGEADNQDFDTNGDATALENQIEDGDPIATEHDITQPEDMSLLDAAADAAENDGELVVEEPMEGQEDEAEAVDAGDIDYDISLDVGETGATAEDATITEVVEVD